MDFFEWQSRKEGVDHRRKEPESDIIEFDAPRNESIEVNELTASTTVVQRLRRFWTDK